jgi:hypothetical protein
MMVAAALATALCIVFFIEQSVQGHLAGLVPDGESSWARGQTNLWISLSTYTIFVAGLWLSARLIGAKSNTMKKLYMFLWNGGYSMAQSGNFIESGLVNKQVKERSQTKHINSAEQVNA